MLKRSVVAASLAAGLSMALIGCAQAPAAQVQDSAADEAKLKADALIWFDHFAKADADAMANLYAEDALLMPPNAPAVSGRAGIRTFLGNEASSSKANGISLKNGTVTGAGVSGDMGWISGNYSVTDKTGATVDSGSYLSVHHRVNGAWLYIRDIWNSDRPLPAPAPAAAPTKKK
jgi:ketosteroid isomerase-like protein